MNRCLKLLVAPKACMPLVQLGLVTSAFCFGCFGNSLMTGEVAFVYWVVATLAASMFGAVWYAKNDHWYLNFGSSRSQAEVDKLIVQLVLLGSLSFPAFVAMFVLAASGGPGPYKIAAITMLMWGFGNLATACSGISTLYALRRDGEGFDERYERKNRQQADRC